MVKNLIMFEFQVIKSFKEELPINHFSLYRKYKFLIIQRVNFLKTGVYEALPFLIKITIKAYLLKNFDLKLFSNTINLLKESVISELRFSIS